MEGQNLSDKYDNYHASGKAAFPKDCQSCPCGSGLADPQQCMVVVCVVVPDVVTVRVTKTVLVTCVCVDVGIMMPGH